MYSFGNSTDNRNFKLGIHSSVRFLNGKVDITHGNSTETYTKDDYLKSIEIQRIGNGNFFGSVVCQRANIKLINPENAIAAQDIIKPYIGVTDYELDVPFNSFKITEINRDENTDELSITAYDGLYSIDKITIQPVLEEIEEELEEEIRTGYSFWVLLEKIATYIGLNGVTSVNNARAILNNTTLTTGYNLASPINLEGTETIRQVIEWIAAAGLSVIYISQDNYLVCKRILPSSSTDEAIDRNSYINLNSKTNRKLVGLARITELGNNIEAKLQETGTIYYIRNNPLMESKADDIVATYLNNRLAEVQRLTINQYDSEWFGNPMLEFGDKISFVDKDGNTVESYIFNDTLSYNGAYTQKSEWQFNEEEREEATPSTLGELLTQTYARVDKANKKIELVVSDTQQQITDVQQQISDTQQQISDVDSKADSVNDALNQANNSISTLTTKLSSIEQTTEEITISVKTIKENGVSKIETGMGYTFNDDGLNITKSDSELSTVINDDGMKVKKNNEEVLVANNQGVDAINLHAKTYLIIGTNSRFEDYTQDGNYTACFWIGG